MRTRTRFAVAVLTVALAACGSDGKNGADGMNGSDGSKGDDGAKGATGDKGAKGADGAKGANGSDGAKGDDGDNGTNGADGAQGDVGDNGTDGDDGLNGDNVILSETARLGLSIARVTLDLDGLDGDEIESVGRGSYLMNAAADCTGCHNGSGPQGQTLYLAGNVEFPIGSFLANGTPCTSGTAGCIDSHVFTRNLTPDPTTGLKLSEDEFVEALHTGKDFKNAGKSLIGMPWAQLRWLTERDLRDMYHYLQQIPAIENAVNDDVKPTFPPAPSPYLDGDDQTIAMFADGDVDRSLPAAFDPVTMAPTTLASEAIDQGNVLRGLAISPLADDALVASMSANQQALYGRGSYLVNGPGLCNECHTPGGRNLDGTVRTNLFLTGGQAFAVPPPLQPIFNQVRTTSGNLVGDNGGFSLPFSGFLNTLLSGLSFTRGTPHMLGFPMPYDLFQNMTIADKQAVYTYITSIQAAGLVMGDTRHQAPARYCSDAGDCDQGETCEDVTIFGVPTKECAGADCAQDSDCGACQTCDSADTEKCLPEDPASACVLSSF